jgi:hypothetical protein
MIPGYAPAASYVGDSWRSRIEIMQCRSVPPILDITDGRGELLWHAQFRVLSTMFHPDDEEQRERLFQAMVMAAIANAGERIPRELVSFFKSPEETEWLMNSASESGYGVAVTGDLLLGIINARFQSPKDASLARAIRTWCEDQARGKTSDGRSVPASERSLRDAWKRFKPVAHLCAAWQLHQDLGAASKIDPSADLLNFLAAAEALRTQGEMHHPPAGRTGSKPAKFSTLDPQQTWHLPSDLKLPTIYLRVPPSTPFVSRVFREYRAD